MCLASAFSGEGRDGPACVPRADEQGCRLHRAAWWQALPAGRGTGVQAHLPCRPTHGCLLCRKTQCAALACAARSIEHRSALHRHMQRAAYSGTLLFVCKKSSTGMTAEGHRHNERAASARPMRSIGTTNKRHRHDYRASPTRPTGHTTMTNERYRNSHYIPFHQLKLCAEICCPAHSVLHLRPLKPKHRHGFHTPCSTIRHRADRQAGAPSGE